LHLLLEYAGRRSGDSQDVELDWSPKLVRIDHNEYAIVPPRSEAVVFIPVMRGVLRSGDTSEIIGRLNLARAGFSLFFIVASIVGGLWPVAVLIVVFDATIYVFQVHRFRQVLAHAEALAARQRAN
jgi:hypothetical protein